MWRTHRTIRANKDQFKSVDYFYSEYERMGKEDFLYWFKDTLTFIPMLDTLITKKSNVEELIGNMLMFYTDRFGKANNKERIKIMKNASKSFPKVKKAFDELHVLLDNMAKEEEAK